VSDGNNHSAVRIGAINDAKWKPLDQALPMTHVNSSEHMGICRNPAESLIDRIGEPFGRLFASRSVPVKRLIEVTPRAGKQINWSH
jgi:hypothetical protein